MFGSSKAKKVAERSLTNGNARVTVTYEFDSLFLANNVELLFSTFHRIRAIIDGNPDPGPGFAIQKLNPKTPAVDATLDESQARHPSVRFD